MNDALTETKFWMIVLASASRTIACSPENESRVKGYIAARGLGAVYTVNVSRFCPDTSIYVLDENTIEAAANQVISGNDRPVKP